MDFSQSSYVNAHVKDPMQEEDNKKKTISSILGVIMKWSEDILNGNLDLDLVSLDSKAARACPFDLDLVRYIPDNQNTTQTTSHLINSLRHITSLARAFEIILANLAQDRRAKKRELYYMDPQLFKNQEYTDQLLKEIALKIQVPRSSLNIFASNKGLLAGNVCFIEGDTCLSLEANQPFPVNMANEHMDSLVTDAKFVLIVEKETVFCHLLEMNALETLGPMILVTGKGYPDLETKYFLSNLSRQKPELPMFFLGDCDPYGADILCQYVFSNELSIYEDCHNIDIYWLGVFPDDLNENCTGFHFCNKLPMKHQDEKKLTELLKRPYFNLDLLENFQSTNTLSIEKLIRMKAWRDQIELMRLSKTKAEIEILYEQNDNSLIDYIVNKICKWNVI